MDIKNLIFLLLCSVGIARGMSNSKPSTMFSYSKPAYEHMYELLMESGGGRNYMGQFRLVERNRDLGLAHITREVCVGSSLAYDSMELQTFQLRGIPAPTSVAMNGISALVGALHDTELLLMSNQANITPRIKALYSLTRDHDLELLSLIVKNDPVPQLENDPAFLERLLETLQSTHEKFKAQYPDKQSAYEVMQDGIKSRNAGISNKVRTINM